MAERANSKTDETIKTWQGELEQHSTIRSYEIEQLLELRKQSNISRRQIRFSEGAPTEHILRKDEVTAHSKVSQIPKNGENAQLASMSDDEDFDSKGGVTIRKPDGTRVVRQPYNPPCFALQKQHGFARFLKDHASPPHNRVTAGGRIVPSGPNSPPLTYGENSIDEFLTSFRPPPSDGPTQLRTLENTFKQPALNSPSQKQASLAEAANEGTGNASSSTGISSAIPTPDSIEVKISESKYQASSQSVANEVATSQVIQLPPGAQLVMMTADGDFIISFGGSNFRATLQGGNTMLEPIPTIQLPKNPAPVLQNPYHVMTQQAPAQMSTSEPWNPMGIAQPLPQSDKQNALPSHNNLLMAGSYQSMMALQNMRPAEAMSSFVPVPSLEQTIPQCVYGQSQDDGSYFPQVPYAGSGMVAPMPVRATSSGKVNDTTATSFNFQDIEREMNNVLTQRKELEVQFALFEGKMNPIQHGENCQKRRILTKRYNTLRTMKKGVESSIQSTKPEQILARGLTNAPPSFPMNTSFPNDFLFQQAQPGSFQSTLSYSRAAGSSGAAYNRDEGNKRTNTKPLSPNAPSFVPGGSGRSESGHLTLRKQNIPQSDFLLGSVYSTVPGAHHELTAETDWTEVVCRAKASSVDQVDLAYCTQIGYNDTNQPKQFCTTPLEIEMVIKNARTHARLYGISLGASKDPEWDAEQDIHQAIHNKVPIPLAPVEPEFVQTARPWYWGTSMFNIYSKKDLNSFQPMQFHRSSNGAQIAARVDLWSHDRILAYKAKHKKQNFGASNDVVGRPSTPNHQQSATTSHSYSHQDSVGPMEPWNSDKAGSYTRNFETFLSRNQVQTHSSGNKNVADSYGSTKESFDLESAYRGTSVDVGRGLPSFIVGNDRNDSKTTPDSAKTSDSFKTNPFEDYEHTSPVASTKAKVGRNVEGSLTEEAKLKMQGLYRKSSVDEACLNVAVNTVPMDSLATEANQKKFLKNMLNEGPKYWEPLPGETREAFEKSYKDAKRIFDVGKATSGHRSDLVFPLMKPTPSKENHHPLQSTKSFDEHNGQVSTSDAAVHKSRVSVASPTFHAQGIVPPVHGHTSASANLSSASKMTQNNGARLERHIHDARNTARPLTSVFTRNVGGMRDYTPPQMRPGSSRHRHANNSNTSFRDQERRDTTKAPQYPYWR